MSNNIIDANYLNDRLGPAEALKSLALNGCNRAILSVGRTERFLNMNQYYETGCD